LVIPDSTTKELSSFFPFDPYALPQSKVFMDDIYRDWASVAIDEDSEDENEDVIRVDTAGPVMGTVAISSLPGSDSEAEQLGTSLGGMSISPARTTNIAS
jgi:RNA polymerase I-specific transcription initiation factor RRN3